MSKFHDDIAQRLDWIEKHTPAARSESALDSLVIGLCEAAGVTPLEYEIDAQERVRVTPDDPAKTAHADALQQAIRSRARVAKAELAALRSRIAALTAALQWARGNLRADEREAREIYDAALNGDT